MSTTPRKRRTLEQKLADEAEALSKLRRSAVARRVREALDAVKLAQVSSGIEERGELSSAADHLANALLIVDPQPEPKQG